MPEQAASIRENRLRKVRKQEGNWPYYACDLTDLDRMGDTLAAIEKDHGLIRVLYNNAGVFHPEVDWLEVPPDQYDDTMAANVRVPFFASQWVAKRLIASGQGGSIVTTASVAGLNGSTVVEYGASKAAVINMTKSMGRRLGKHGIRVNAIAPGLIKTAMGARVPEVSKQRALSSALGRRRRSPRWSTSWSATPPVSLPARALRSAVDPDSGTVSSRPARCGTETVGRGDATSVGQR
jgi:3-oxoacyl-[acyl-carrier protein] reductase